MNKKKSQALLYELEQHFRSLSPSRLMDALHPKNDWLRYSAARGVLDAASIGMRRAAFELLNLAKQVNSQGLTEVPQRGLLDLGVPEIVLSEHRFGGDHAVRSDCNSVRCK